MRTNCGVCGGVLNQPGKPATGDCAGDCVACLADYGDPDCKAVMQVLNARDGYAIGPFSKVRFSYTRFDGAMTQTCSNASRRQGVRGDLVNTIQGEGAPGEWTETRYLRGS